MPRSLPLSFLLMLVAASVLGGESGQPAPSGPVCSEAWYRSIEARLRTSDAQGHGPDVGSEEWKSVVEFKLGIRDRPGVPERDGDAWCRYVDRLVRERGGHASAAPPRGPSYACDKVQPGSIEAMICGDDELSALDRTLADVYAAASEKAANEHPPRLAAEQRGWIKGRDECWKSDDKRGCVRDEYRRRIAELQARYRLVSATGPVRFVCGDADEVVATFFQTDPRTLIAERGDRVSLMYVQPSASGARYQGRNETFWEHQGEAMVVWGYGAPELHCKKAP